MAKILFFQKSSKPNTAETTAIARLRAMGYAVAVRSAASVSGKPEACDGVAGTVPSLYDAAKATASKLSKVYDAVLEATSTGKEGNDITVKMVGDSDSGVTINRTGSAFVIHFQAGVSTVGNVNTAITA